MAWRRGGKRYFFRHPDSTVLSTNNDLKQEKMLSKRVIPNIGIILKGIRLKLFLDVVSSSLNDDVTKCIAWMSRGGFNSTRELSTRVIFTSQDGLANSICYLKIT